MSKLTDAKTISVDTLWYDLLGQMERLGIKVQRKSFKARLKAICDKAGIRRDQLNIITGARAELYFNGKWESVSFDKIEELSAEGTDILFIEKEGIPDELKEFADKWGIAMVNSRGYLTEFAHDLMMAARDSGANIMIMTDYDLSGINLASKCSEDAIWVTMDDRTLAWFGLDKSRDSKTLVVAATNIRLIDSVTDLKDNDDRFRDIDIEFLKTKRIEINAVIAKVGADRFWKFIVFKLAERYPKRNYNRAIKLPSKDPDADEIDLLPPAIKSLFQHIRSIRDTTVETTEEEITEEQEEVEGFLEVEEQKKKNIKRVKKVIADDEDIKKVEAATTKLCDYLGFDISSEDEDV
jgi:hypothetical protein